MLRTNACCNKSQTQRKCKSSNQDEQLHVVVVVHTWPGIKFDGSVLDLLTHASCLTVTQCAPPVPTITFTSHDEALGSVDACKARKHTGGHTQDTQNTQGCGHCEAHTKKKVDMALQIHTRGAIEPLDADSGSRRSMGK
jgi:hypothetical protein